MHHTSPREDKPHAGLRTEFSLHISQKKRLFLSEVLQKRSIRPAYWCLRQEICLFLTPFLAFYIFNLHSEQM